MSKPGYRLDVITSNPHSNARETVRTSIFKIEGGEAEKFYKKMAPKIDAAIEERELREYNKRLKRREEVLKRKGTEELLQILSG